MSIDRKERARGKTGEKITANAFAAAVGGRSRKEPVILQVAADGRERVDNDAKTTTDYAVPHG